MAKISDWIYIAPQRIRADELALPKLERWAEMEALNMQRLARVLDFQDCIAFVGSGMSVYWGYPSWSELIPELGEKEYALKSLTEWFNPDLKKIDFDKEIKLISLRKAAPSLGRKQEYFFSGQFRNWVGGPANEVDITQAIQMIEELRGDRTEIINHLKEKFFIGEEPNARKTRMSESEKKGSSPLKALLKMPIHRFVTTNYDEEIEKALEESLRLSVLEKSKSFEQSELEKLMIFAISDAGENRNMVFHCHGNLDREIKRLANRNKSHRGTSISQLVLTDADYNYWYLSHDARTQMFRRGLDIVLQSSPLFFVGYTLNDVDLLRILRRDTLRAQSERVASKSFLLLNLPSFTADEDMWDIWKKAKQIKLGVNLLPYVRNEKHTLAIELERINKECARVRSEWHLQARVRKQPSGPVGTIRTEWKSPKIKREKTIPGITPKTILKALQRHSVVAITGPYGSGKFLKVCQFLDIYSQKYRQWEVYHSLNNDDIYSYLKRTQLLCELEVILDKKSNSSGPKLIVINNIDQLLEVESGKKWQPRNGLARDFVDKLFRISAMKIDEVPLKILLTARNLPEPEPGNEQQKGIHAISLAARGKRAFSAAECWLTEAEFRELRHDYSALILAGRVLSFDWPQVLDRSELTRPILLQKILHIARTSSSEKSCELVRYIVRLLELQYGLRYETLLWLLSCFNTPIDKQVFDQTLHCCEHYLSATKTGPESQSRSSNDLSVLNFPSDTLQGLLELGLVQAIESKPAIQGGRNELNYIVPPLVKRLFRQILEQSQQYPEMQEFGLHGLLSRGPFNNPGESDKAKRLFNYFANAAFEYVKQCFIASKNLDAQEKSRLFIRALIDILRSNFACGSVPLWGQYRDYIDMLSICIDLLRNFAISTQDFWSPGKPGEPGNPWSVDDKKTKSSIAVATADEMLYLYNELGLAYYSTGSVQDALSVWGLAAHWQKVLSDEEASQQNLSVGQGAMYEATIYSHMGTAHLQMGKMQAARECFERAQKAARETKNEDLVARMEGMLARIAHFRGSIKESRRVYLQVVQKLGEVGNRRAQSYFMRHLASLETRFGRFEKAEVIARESLAIAASENALDMVAFSSELLGKVACSAGQYQKAIREYRIALTQAKKLDISRLEADILLGMAEIQLRLGDASAASHRATKALRIANENLLVLRQVKGLVLLGRTAAEFGETKLARDILHHAKRLAADSEFRLAEHDAEVGLADLRVGGSE